MMLKDLVLKNRSYRGFDESVRISRETLEGFVDCARLCPSSVNKQPLKYFLAWEPEEVEKVQGLTKWARALPEMVLPHPGKRLGRTVPLYAPGSSAAGLPVLSGLWKPL